MTLTLREIMAGNLSPIQESIILSNATNRVLLFGRQSGKSTTLRILAYQELVTEPREILYVLKTYRQSKELGWRFLVEGHDPVVPREFIQDLHRSELTATMINGSRIRFVGSENVDSLVGLTIDTLIMDETQSQKPDVWPYLQPMLAARDGRAIFAGTARGYDHFYDLYWRGALENPQRVPGWRSWRVKTQDSGTPAGRPQAIAAARASMSPKLFAQEYEASPHALTGLILDTWDPIMNGTDLSLDRNLPLIVGMDFNVGKMVAVVYQIRDGAPHALAEHVMENTKTQRFIQAFRSRFGEWGSRVTFHPDASGGARRTSSTNTDHQIIREAGYQVNSPRSNPAVRDRINTFDRLVCDANGHRSLRVSQRCPELLRSLQGLTWMNGEMDKTSGLDHAFDAASYPIYNLYKSRGISQISAMHA